MTLIRKLANLHEHNTQWQDQATLHHAVIS